jgi:hypothetical protein
MANVLLPTVNLGTAVPPLLQTFGAEVWVPGIEMPGDLAMTMPTFPYSVAEADQLYDALTPRLSQSLSAYRAVSPDMRTRILLETAHMSNRIPYTDPVFFAFSPFGNHGADFLVMAVDDELPFNNAAQRLDIGCFGAGFHDAYSVLRSVFQRRGQSAAILEPLREAQFAAHGPKMASSNEPRELLALLLAGQKPGSITVIDTLDDIGRDLRVPTLSYMNSIEVYLSGHGSVTQFYDRYWGIIAAGRDTCVRKFGGKKSHSVTLKQFDFSPEEIGKLRFARADLALDPIPIAPETFGLSVWLEGSYFFPAELQIGIAAAITDRTRIGGYVLTDIRMSSAMQDTLGLELRRAVFHEILRAWYCPLMLFERVRRTPWQRELVEMMEGRR